jgi:hypothetical protein
MFNVFCISLLLVLGSDVHRQGETGIDWRVRKIQNTNPLPLALASNTKSPPPKNSTQLQLRRNFPSMWRNSLVENLYVSPPPLKTHDNFHSDRPTQYN